MEEVFYYQGLPYVPKVICSDLINRHHDKPFTDHFGIPKTWELIATKYYKLMLQKDVEAYVKGCDMCLTFKAVWYKHYGGFELLLVLTHQWKDLSIDFVMSLLITANWKNDSNNLILVIVNKLTKKIYYESVKVTIDVSGLAKVIIIMVVCHHGVPESIITDQDLLFTSKFWSLLCYFLGIKRKLYTTFNS